jgi:hypothetical protein
MKRTRVLAAIAAGLLLFLATYPPSIHHACAHFATRTTSESSTWADKFRRMSLAEFKAWMDARRPAKKTEAERKALVAAIGPEQS